MRRVLMIVGAAAAMAAFSNRAMAAHTQAEIHIFFGSGLVDGIGVIPAAPTPVELSTNPTVALLPGHFVVFPIWLRMMPGDFPTGALTGVGFRVFDSGSTGSVSNGGNTNNFLWPTGAQTIAGSIGNGATNSTIDPTLSLKQFRTGYYNLKGALDANVGAGTYLLGTMRVDVASGALENDLVDFWFATSGDPAGSDLVSTGTGTNATVGFGANGTGGPDAFRRGNTLLDIQGANQSSTIADASVRVLQIPEPMTIGLLALGLIGLRRRQVA